MKRFTETTKWRDVWHRRLTTVQKCLWSLICDMCDHAGVFEFDEEICGFDIGAKVKLSDLEAFGDRVRHLHGQKWVIVKFINFQYGKLSPDCKPHKPVYAALQKHGLTAEEFEQNPTFRGLVDGYLRDKIIARDGGKCAYTGRALLPAEIAIDHIQPRSKGGATKPFNLVCMDAKLNNLKADLTLEEFCSAAGLNILEVRERLSNTLSKPLEPLSGRLLGSLQEKEKDKDKDKDKAGESAERGTGATSNTDSNPLPFTSSAFAEAWGRWQTHRREIHKPLTPTTTEQQLKLLGAMGEVRAIAAISNSIRGGYQGIFEPRTQSSSTIPTTTQQQHIL